MFGENNIVKLSVESSEWSASTRRNRSDFLRLVWEIIRYRGRVEKTDPRSADYPLTPIPRTTLQTTPMDYPK